MVQASSDGQRLVVTADGQGLEGRAGAGLLRASADRFGLTAALRGAVDRVRSWQTHAPGAVVRDLAVMLADGGTAQREACVARIRDADWTLVDEYVDRGESARSIDRPQLQALLADAAACLHSIAPTGVSPPLNPSPST